MTHVITSLHPTKNKKKKNFEGSHESNINLNFNKHILLKKKKNTFNKYIQIKYYYNLFFKNNRMRSEVVFWSHYLIFSN